MNATCSLVRTILTLSALATAGVAQRNSTNALDLEPVRVSLAASTPVEVHFQRSKPSLGFMAIGWKVRNLTADKLEVTLEREYFATGGWSPPRAAA